MSRTSHSTEDLERELAELGEAAPSDDELAWVCEREAEIEDHPDVATTLRLVELSEPLDMPGLSELETRRVWQTIEQRRSKPKPAASTQQHPAGGGARRWLFAAVGLAAAAALIVIVISPDDATLLARRDADGARRGADAGPSAEQVAELGDKVRASLAALDDGKSDTARATELAGDYERRLAASKAEREERGG